MKEKFPVMWKVNRAFATDLLPDNAEFDEVQAVVRMRHSHRETRTLNLSAPAVDEMGAA